LEKTEAPRGALPGRLFPVLVTHMTTAAEVEAYARSKGIAITRTNSERKSGTLQGRGAGINHPTREAYGMSWLRRTLHIGVGLGALAVRRAQEVARRLEAEGRQVLERPDNPVEKARARLGRWTESVRKTFQELAVHLYYTVGVTPLQETQRLHQRVDELETRLTRKTRGDAARSNS